MTKSLLIAAVVGVLSSTAQAQPAQQKGVELVLLSSINVDPRLDSMVWLQDPRANGCKYAGQLTRYEAKDSSLSDKATTLLLNGDQSRWSIAIKRQFCQEIAADVSFTVPLARISGPDGYPAGKRVFAVAN